MLLTSKPQQDRAGFRFRKHKKPKAAACKCQKAGMYRIKCTHMVSRAGSIKRDILVGADFLMYM